MIRRAFLAIALFALAGSGCVGQRQPLPNYTQEISISAKQFEFQPSQIKVKSGQHVKITVTSQDVDHGVAVPDLNLVGLKTEARKVVLDFTPQKPGTYRFVCQSPCGEGHDRMVGTLTVE